MFSKEPLYKVTNQYLQAYEDLFCNPDIPQEAISDTLGGIAAEFNDKALNIAALIKNIEADADNIKEAERTMKERRDRLSKQAESLRDYLLNNLQAMPKDKQKVFSAEIEIKISKCPPSVDIDAMVTVPDEYMRMVPEKKEPDKIKLKDALNNGVEIKGVLLVQRNKLVIQ